MVLLDHVRIARYARVMNRHVSDSRMVVMNFESGNNKILGTCSRNEVDLSRYGVGDWRVMLYATTLLHDGG